MNVLRNWDTTPAYDGQGGARMTPGGHLCKIMGAKVETSARGYEQLVLALEVVDEGELNGFYGRQYNSRKRSAGDRTVNWPCRFFQNTQDANGNASPWFKGLIKAVEESNAGWKWDWRESNLAKCLVGFIFREEEYVNQNGEIKTNVKPVWPCSRQRIAEGVEVPEIRRLNNGGPVQTAAFAPSSGFTPVEDEELPF